MCGAWGVRGIAKSYVTLSVSHSVWLIALAARVASYTGIGLTSHSNHELNLYCVRALFMCRVSYKKFWTYLRTSIVRFSYITLSL